MYVISSTPYLYKDLTGPGVGVEVRVAHPPNDQDDENWQHDESRQATGVHWNVIE